MAEADALPGLTGTEQSNNLEENSVRPVAVGHKDPYRQSRGRTASGGDPGHLWFVRRFP